MDTKWNIDVDYPHQPLVLTTITEGDRETFFQLLGSSDAVYRQTLRIPYPYTLEDSDWFINFNRERLAELGYPMNYAVRNRENGILMGVVGIVSIENGRAEIGYWLGEQYWGQGIASHCLRSFVKAIGGSRDYGIQTFTAAIFSGNDRSASCLRKAGFRFENHIAGAYEKNGVIIAADNYILDVV